MRYRFDLHLHSYHSFDGVMAPRHMVALAKRRGLHGIAVTDHNSVRGGSAAFDLQCDDDFLVIPGTEIATDIGDILGLFVTEEIQSRQCTDVIAEMRAQGGVVILPHPFSHHRDLTPELLEQFDAVEVYNGRDRRDLSDQIRNELARPYGLTEMGNSDAHLYWEIGQAYNELDIEDFSGEGVRHALLSGQCHPVRARARSATAVYTSKIVKRLKRLI